MDYLACLASCIATLRDDGYDGVEDHVTLLSGYPVPTDEEWLDVLASTAEYENVADPFACMGQYEFCLSQRGFRTVLGAVVGEHEAIAAKVGLPREFLADAIALSTCTNR